MAKVRLYALGLCHPARRARFGAGFVLWDAVHPAPLRPV